jgi:hypothetical protein
LDLLVFAWIKGIFRRIHCRQVLYISRDFQGSLIPSAWAVSVST